MLRLGSLHLVYICLANHSAVLKYMQAAGFLAAVKCAVVRCARPSVRSLCTLLVLFVVFFGCRDFAFSNDHDICLRNKQNAYEHFISSTAYDPCVPCQGKIQAPRGSLYSYHTRILCPILLPFPEHVWRQFFHHLALSLTLTPTTTTNY